ncbi:hypothetical protein PM082_010345 [Marasmius tenuissimus]|nr:hypothetical protein PM082_010345 [Marasmius tenuissimus]
MFFTGLSVNTPVPSAQTEWPLVQVCMRKEAPSAYGTIHLIRDELQIAIPRIDFVCQRTGTGIVETRALLPGTSASSGQMSVALVKLRGRETLR